MSVAWTAYRLMAPALGALAPAARMFTSPPERALWGERLGHVSCRGGCDAWVHAASLGEAGAAAPLVDELLRTDGTSALYLTATTRAGRSRLMALGRPASLAPIDSPQAVVRFFAGVRPRRAFVVETELWPHWLLHARAAKLPIAIVSARLSLRSLDGYRRLGGELRRLVSGLSAVLCQGEEDRERWLAIGARAEVTSVAGNLKWDGLPRAAADRAAARARLGLDPARPLLVLGSVRPGEGHLLARAWGSLEPALRERWQVVAVPRHLRASREVEAEARRAGVGTVRGTTPVGGAWRWDDRPGVLNGYYEVADAAVVGGSLRPYGGHNPLEPAACGAAVVIGPHHASQADAVAALQRHDAVRVVAGGRALGDALRGLLGDDTVRARAGSAGLETVAGLRGSARRTVRELIALGLWPVSR